MKKLNIIAALVAFFAGSASNAVDEYYVPTEENPVIKYDVYNQGETFEDSMSELEITSTYTLGENYINPIMEASKDLINTLNIDAASFSSPVSLAIVTQNEYNAAAVTLYAHNILTNKMPYLQAILQKKASNIDIVPALIIMGLGVTPENPGWGTTDVKSPLYSGDKPYLYSVMLHEMFHAVGIISGAMSYSPLAPSDYSFSKNLSDPIFLWDSFLKIDKDGTEISPQRGMHIKYSENSEGDFDIYNYSPYFVGENTLKTLTGTTDKSLDEMKQIIRDKGGLKNYSPAYEDNDELPIVYGVPIHPSDYIASAPDLSHIELRNSFMSHQNYRNWLTPMEAEYAILKDLGYNVEPKEHFGKSYYLNNVTDNFDSGYSKWDAQSQQYTDEPSSVTYGTGLHIYGDNNNISQTSNVLSSGEAVIGARIEGVGNTYSLKNGSVINLAGDNSSAIAATWGKNHTINLEQGSTVSSTGENGIGINFNFGSSILGDYIMKKGSYIHSEYTPWGTLQFAPDIETQGALVDNINIRGNVIGKYAAIYIADNAYVNNINIYTGSNIQGNIISDWNSIVSGNESAVSVFYNNHWIDANPDVDGLGYFTNLNFGTSSESYNGTFTYDIIGDNGIYNTLKMSVSPNSSLTLDNSNIAVYNLKNDGTINVNNVTKISTQNTNDSIYGSGNINVNQLGVLTLGDKVRNVNNNVNVVKGATLSTANDVESSHTFSNLATADGSKLSFDIGDTIKINDNTGSSGQSKFSSIKISPSQLSDLVSQGLGYQQVLFDEDGQTINMGNNYFNIYNGDKKYSMMQDSDNPNIIKVRSILDADSGIKEAAQDPSTGNYIVEVGEVQEQEGGTVDGDTFEITGNDLNFGQHNGLIVDGTKNEYGTTVKVSTYNATADDTYKGTYTVINGGKLFIEDDENDVEIKDTINTDIPNSAIYLDSTSTADLNSIDKKINISGKIQGENGAIVTTRGKHISLNKVDSAIVRQSADNLNINGTSTNTIWHLNQGITRVSNDSYLSSDGTNSLVLNGGTLNLQNGSATKIDLASMNVSANSNVLVDMDFATSSIDRFAISSPDNLNIDDVVLNISDINMMNSNKVNSDYYKIDFVNPSLNNTKLLGKVNANVGNITTPIYKYNVNYQEDANSGSLVFSTPAGRDSYQSYNPAVMATSVAAQVGGYLNQLVSYDVAFSNMDMIMNFPYEKRYSMLLKNRYAAADDTLMRYDPNQLPDFNKGLWFKPYTAFEKVELKNGPKVNNVNYGGFIGADSTTHQMKHGWNGMYSGYIGYSGARQSYDSITTYQDGVNAGLSGILYKRNFFTGLTANGGVSLATAGTVYGRDEFALFSGGAAWKSGYNWEFNDGKFIVQPNYLMSYSIVGTSNYTNGAGVKIKSDPLNSLQIAPGLKIIMNTKTGWQPYLTAQMIWNIYDKTKIKANNIDLPYMSVKPYVQYGIGAKKTISDFFTFYGQTLVRNGGRTGLSFSLGMKWALGLERNKF